MGRHVKMGKRFKTRALILLGILAFLWIIFFIWYLSSV